MEELLTTGEAARLTGLSTAGIKKAEREGKLTAATKIGHHERLFTVDEIRRFILARNAKAELRREQRSRRKNQKSGAKT